MAIDPVRGSNPFPNDLLSIANSPYLRAANYMSS
jgi:hypothetical protein